MSRHLKIPTHVLGLGVGLEAQGMALELEVIEEHIVACSYDLMMVTRCC